MHHKEYLHGVIGVVEANSFEKMCLWQENERSTKPKKWVENASGLIRTAGHVNELPVTISLITNEIDGHAILFYHACSRMVDYDLVDEWLNKNLPVTAFKSNDPRLGINRADAMNFHNVFPRD